ncbi:hypothetical protein L484_000274 [Morus notabilis]|uniref:Uncharacterized protein n=1 Tax=Morus notabilis TaxID=981085 RepID=W9T1F7_9ROSA|nr:hypothetical protein L484_000274 [Morus notabilis]
MLTLSAMAIGHELMNFPSLFLEFSPKVNNHYSLVCLYRLASSSCGTHTRWIPSPAVVHVVPLKNSLT